MKIGHLIKILNTFNPKAEIYLSTDSEGNSYGTIGNTSFGEDDEKGFYVLYPEEEGLDYEDMHT